MKIEVLAQTSVDKLRTITKSGKDILSVPFEELVNNNSLRMVKLEVNFNSEVALIKPKGITQEENQDLKNCLLIAEALPNLSEIDATDERLWVTLSLREYKEYALARWPFEKSQAASPSKHCLNHWFAPMARVRMRDHAISRLWWYHNICARISESEVGSNLDKLFFNSDYRSSLLERNSSTAISNVVNIILEITQKYDKQGIYFKRDNFRDFMKLVDFAAGRSRFAVMRNDQLKSRLDKLYREAYKID
jgi:hypothetical protein